ncbi:MAG: OmpA family protein, partial [Longimicrobiales bacterium]
VDLALSQVATPDPFMAGEAGSFDFTVTSVGTDATADTIFVRTLVPEGVTVGDLPPQGPWTLRYDPATRELVALRTDPTVSGDVSTFSIPVQVGADQGGQTLTHQGRVFTAGDENADNDIATVDVGVEGDVIPPVDPVLSLTKQVVGIDAVEIGDLVSYVLTLESDWNQPFTSVTVTDALPSGFYLKSGTVRLDGQTIPEPPSRAPVLAIDVGVIDPGQSRRLTYQLVVGAGATRGPAVNTAVAMDAATSTQAAPVIATVEVRDDGVFTEEAIIVGKVYADIDTAHALPGELARLGIPGVRVLLQDGTSVITDAEGNFNFVGLRPRLWVVRVDQSTLPEALNLKPITNRHADRGTSVFADLVKGELHRVDFGAYETEVDSLWGLAADNVLARRAVAANAEENRGGGVTWPMLNGWVRDSTAMQLDRGIPSAFGEVLPEWSINNGNSSLSPRPADPVAAGLIGPRATQDGPLGLAMVGSRAPVARGDSTIQLHLTYQPDPTSAGPDPDAAIVTFVTVEASRGRWIEEDLDSIAPGLQVEVHGTRTLTLQAPGSPGDGVIRATADRHEVQLLVPWSGDNQRPFLLTGLIEGRVDGRSLEDRELALGSLRDGLQDRIRDISFDSDDGRYSGGLRAAAFATGDIGEETTLTLRVDSEKQRGRQFFGDIRPEDFYGIYGDAGSKSFGAQSRGRVFGALERGRSYLMYGDFLTGYGRGEAQTLGRYSRTLNGVAQHFEKDLGSVGLRVDGFASYDRGNQIVDEIRGLGISGPYELSRTDGLINSEQVEIVVRDRNQPSIILRREQLTRFLDYSVEPFTGRLLFKRPIPSLDEQLNPVSVRVSYEVQDQSASRFWVYGIDGSVQASKRLELGAGMVRDEGGMGGMDLSSANGTVGLTDNTFLFGEFARTTRQDLVGEDISGDAGRLELRHASRRLDARAYYLETDSLFQNRSSGFIGGRKEVGLRGRADLTRRFQLLGEALRTESLLTGGEREGAQVALRYGEGWSAEVGYRYAEEVTPPTAETADVGPYDLNALRARITAPLPAEVDGAVFTEYEQDTGDSSQRRLMVGGDLRLFDRARIYGRHELISSLVGPYGLNPLQEQNNTVFGIAADYRAGTQIFSEYRAKDAFAGREAQAAIGLRNQWAVADGMRVNTSFERLSPLGTDARDALALTGALEYTASPLWKGTVRGEYRSAGEEDHLLGSLGYAGRLSDSWTLLGQSVFSHVFDGPTYERSRIGLAYRDIGANKWNGLWRYEHRYDQRPDEGSQWNRSANIFSTHFDYRPADRLTLRGQYGAKQVRESLDDEEATEPSSLVGGRITYDLGARLDAGLAGWALRTGALLPAGFSDAVDPPQSRYAAGVELGWTAARDLRVAVGYNAFGFVDDDLVPEQPTDQGFYLKVGFKLDQLWGDAPVPYDPPADLSVSQIPPDTVLMDTATDIWLFPRNDGPNRARRVVLEETLPPGAQLVEASDSAQAEDGVVRWQLGNLEPGDGPPKFLRVVFPDTGRVALESRVEANSPDSVPGNNVDWHQTEVVSYQLNLTKSAPENAGVGDPVTYEITVTNEGPLVAENVVIQDSIPVGALVAGDTLTGDTSASLGGGTLSGGVVTWPARRLEVGQSATVRLTLSYPLAGRYRNVMLATAPISPTVSSHDIEIGVPADVTIELFAPERLVVGEALDYGVHVFNRGGGLARNVVVEQILPVRAEIDSIGGRGGSQIGGRLVWAVGDMEPGDEAFLPVWTRAGEAGLYHTEASVFSDYDNKPQENSVVGQTLVLGWDLDVDVEAGEPDSNGVVEYTLQVRNRGPAGAPYVVVEDSVAPGGTFVSASRAATDFGDVVRWAPLRELGPGATSFDTLRVRYDLPGMYRNVSLASAQGYWVLDDVETSIGESADQPVEPVLTPDDVGTPPRPRLVVTSVGPSVAAVGIPVQYDAVAVNDTVNRLESVRLAIGVPSSGSVSEISEGGVQQADSVIWELGAMEPGDDRYANLVLTYMETGTFQVGAVLAESGGGGSSGQDQVTTVVVDGLPTLSMIGPDQVHEGDTVVYVIETTGLQPGTTNGLAVVDSLPVGATFIEATRGGLHEGGVVSWPEIPELAPGATVTDTLWAAFDVRGDYINSVTVSLDNLGGSPGSPVVRDQVETRVGIQADIQVELQATPTVRVGEPALYHIHTFNRGMGQARDIDVAFRVASGSRVDSVTAGGTFSDGIVSWPTVPAMEPGDEQFATVFVTYEHPGLYAHRATLTSEFDPDPTNDEHEAITEVLERRLSVTLRGPEEVIAGELVTYEIETVLDAATPIDSGRVTDVLPPDTRYERGSGADVHESGVVRWEMDEGIVPGAPRLDTLQVTYPRGGIYTNTVVAEAGPLLDSATAQIRVLPVDMPTPAVVYFDFNADSLTLRTRTELTKIVTQLTRLPASLHIDLIGHADIIGSDAVNDPLSERRALAVQNFLSQWGINSHRLTTDGRG